MPKRGRGSESSAVIAKRIKSKWGAGKRTFTPKPGLPELKAVDYYSSTTNLDQASATTPTLLNSIGAGTDFYQRVGRKVVLKSIMIKGECHISSGNGTGAVTPYEAYPVRVALVYDDQVNGAAPAVSDIFQAVTAGGSTASYPFVGVNLNNRDRFKILKDWVFVLRPNTTASGSVNYGDGFGGKKDFKAFVRLNNDEIFSGTSTGVSAIQTGALWLVAYQFQSALTNQPTACINFATRVRYADA